MTPYSCLFHRSFYTLVFGQIGLLLDYLLLPSPGYQESPLLHRSDSSCYNTYTGQHPIWDANFTKHNKEQSLRIFFLRRCREPGSRKIQHRSWFTTIYRFHLILEFFLFPHWPTVIPVSRSIWTFMWKFSSVYTPQIQTISPFNSREKRMLFLHLQLRLALLISFWSLYDKAQVHLPLEKPYLHSKFYDLFPWYQQNNITY